MGIKDKLPLIRSEKRITRIFGYVVYAFAILHIIGILTPSETPDAPPATPTQAPEAPTPEPTSAATPDAPTATHTPEAPTATPTPEATPEPITLSGTEQEATSKFSLEKGLSLFRMTHDGDGHFGVVLLNSEGDHIDLLANEIGEFDGSKAVGISKAGIYLLDISADGNWEISIE